jgi:VCBS repeat-containing protein
LNYSGKFDAKLPFEGPGAPHHSHIHVDSVSAHGAPVGAIVVPDAQLLFNGDFKRSGVDLILSRDDRELVLQDYFKGEKRAALSSPDGAHLTGDIIDALTGHQQFAQAGGGASAGKVIGHLTKLIGSASAIRNGVSIILNNGDNVEKGDVVQSGSNSTVGITFIDGTVFGLSSNARMVLNEMVYDPNGSNNSSLLSLVAGTISFVAGETAKHGDMKVDTPVATMGIRGTAVLVEIDFDVTGQGGAPAAKFQVLVEPDGTTGRYVLFDKVTLAPIATVDQAGVVKSLSQGILTSYSAPLSADVQKLITDVFSLKFSDNTNTKTQDHQFTDSIIPQAFTPVKLADGSSAVPIIVNLPTSVTPTVSGPTGPTDANPHIPGPPAVFAVAGALIETIGVTNSSAIDTASGIIRFADLNAGDTPTVKTKFGSFTYQDAQHHDVTTTLSAQQLADIAAVEANLVLVPDPGNKNTGSVTWTYSIADSAFDFIAAGETLTLTYIAQVDNNFALNNETAFQSFTITITRGANDVPTIVSALTTATGAVTEDAALTLTATGTITYQDVDLTDTHTAAFVLKSSDANANLPGYSESAPFSEIGTFALGKVNENTADTINIGSVGWTFKLDDSNPVLQSLAEGQTITQVYTVTIDDGHGGAVSQDVTVTITGTNDAPTIVVAYATGAVTEDATTPNLSTTGSITFNDVDLIDTHTTSVVADGGNTLGGTLTMGAVSESAGAAAGTVGWTYTVADSATEYLAAGQTATEKFTVTIDDGHGGTVDQVVTITVTGTNDAPTITAATATGAVTEDATTPNLSTTGGITFNDVDLIDVHTTSVVANGGNKLGGTLTMGAVSESAGTTAGTVGWTYTVADHATDYLAFGQTATEKFTVTISDGHGGTVDQLVTITVTGTNDAPTIVAGTTTASGDVTEDSNVVSGNLVTSGTIGFNDVDLIDPHTTSVVADGGNKLGGTLTMGAVSEDASTAAGTVGWTYKVADHATDYLAAGQTATEKFTVTIADGHGGTVAQVVTITVTGANEAPDIHVVTTDSAAATLTETNAGLSICGTLTVNDADVADTVHSSVTTVTASGAITGLGLTNLQLLAMLSVAPASGLAADPGASHNLTWTFDSGTEAFNYLAANQSLVLTYTVKSTDSSASPLSDTQSVTITINGTNDAPKILSETNPVKQTVVTLSPVTPIVLAAGVNENALGLHTEKFDSEGQPHGSPSDNGLGAGGFHSAILDADFSASGHAGFVNGSSVSASAAPFMGPGVVDPTNYLSIGAGGTETIKFAQDQNAFGLYWGSVDSYNTISFYHGMTLVASYTGADVSPLFPTGNQGSFSSNGYVEFAGLSPFDKVVLGSSSNAFEIDNISAGTVPAPHVKLAAPITGTINVSDADIGDTLTASVTGDAVITYNGPAPLPGNANVDALKAASAIKFDSVQTNGGVNVLHWTYDPDNPNLDFLKSGDTLTISFTAQVNDGHGSVGSQALTITIGGAAPSANMSQLQVVNGTSGNDTFNHVGNNVTIFGAGGHDTFVFNDAHFGSATIGDFDVNNDTINVNRSLFATVEAFVNAAHSANSDHDTIITDAAQDTITLKGVTLAQFQAHQGDYHVLT